MLGYNTAMKMRTAAAVQSAGERQGKPAARSERGAKSDAEKAAAPYESVRPRHEENGDGRAAVEPLP